MTTTEATKFSWWIVARKGLQAGAVAFAGVVLYDPGVVEALLSRAPESVKPLVVALLPAVAMAVRNMWKHRELMTATGE